MAQYQCLTDAMIEYMELYLEDFHRNKGLSRQLHVSKSTKQISELLKNVIPLDK